MADRSAIERTRTTWNWATGCTKISEGCKIHQYWSRKPWYVVLAEIGMVLTKIENLIGKCSSNLVGNPDGQES